MRRIVIEGDFLFLYLNRNFYTEETIMMTIKTYKDFLDVLYSKVGKYDVLRLRRKNSSYDLETLGRELGNYLMAMEYEKR